MKARVIRVLEYIYPDRETMKKDMDRWEVNAYGTRRFGPMKIKSSTLTPEEDEYQQLPPHPPIKVPNPGIIAQRVHSFASTAMETIREFYPEDELFKTGDGTVLWRTTEGHLFRLRLRNAYKPKEGAPDEWVWEPVERL